MSWWRQLSRGTRALLRRRSVERELREEIEHYLEQAVAAHRARGLEPRQAMRAARLELGGETSVSEQVRSYGWENVVSSALADLRYAARRLRRDPSYTVIAALVLALGIGATTAIFSAVHPILLRPLPYPGGDRVVTVWEIAGDGTRLETTFAAQRALAERSQALAALAVTRPWTPTLTGGGAAAERLDGQRVSADYFPVLGVRPARGRWLAAAEDRPGAPRVVVLSDALWRRRFGARDLLGGQVTLDGEPHTVVGIMPASFENVLAPTAQLWTPLRYDSSLPQAWGHHLRAVGRLQPGVTPAQAQQELGSLLPALRRELPDANLGAGLQVVSLRADVARELAPALLAVTGAALLLLLVACVNVAHLTLTRGARRRSELAVRLTLGAGRLRVARQLLSESLLLAALGGVLGVALAAAGLRTLLALSPLDLSRTAGIGVDATVLVFALALSTLVGVACGSWPALRHGRADLQLELRRVAPRTLGGGEAGRGRLVVAEVALAVVLLVGCGLLLRSVQRLLAVAPGFTARGVLVLQVQASGQRFDDETTTHRFFAEVLAAVRSLPGVQSVGSTSQLPLSGDDDTYGVRLQEARPRGAGDDVFAAGPSAHRYAVAAGYFRSLGIPLRRGRLLAATDRAGTQPVAVVDESFARQAFAGDDPIGRRLQMGPHDGPWFTIVGVVGDVKQHSLAASAVAAAVYLPAEQWSFADRARWLVVRTARQDPVELAPAVRAAVWSVDRDQPVTRVSAMETLVAASTARQRFALALFQLFAVVALALAAAGIYGVLSAAVAERRRELGLRAALGAGPRQVLGQVLGQGARLTLLGAGLGLAAAIPASTPLSSLLYGIERLDPVSYASGALVLLVVAAVACGAPAWRAAHVDPATVLREE